MSHSHHVPVCWKSALIVGRKADAAWPGHEQQIGQKRA
jgi:hypothetical protein